VVCEVMIAWKKTSMQCGAFEFFSEKKVANICESDLQEATDGSCEAGLRSSRVLMAFQISEED